MGGLLGSKPKTSSSTSNTVVVPGWLNTPNQDVVSRATELSKTPYKSYTGQRVADFSSDTTNAMALNRQNTGKYNNLMDSASNGVLQLLQRASGPSSSDIQSLMNPYTQNVLDTSMRKAAENAGYDQAALKRQAGLSGSFGGSRFGVQQQKQANDLTNNMNDIQYQGMSDAFKNALSQWNIGTDTLNSGINSALTTTAQGQQYDTNDIANLLKTGSLQEDKTQQELDVVYSDWDTEQAYPYEQVSWLSSILNPLTGAYSGSTSVGGQTTSGGSSKLAQGIGMAASVASLFARSDERIKENIEEVGKLDNGLSVYKYNFIGEPRTQIGVMAQEVEKSNPDAVMESPEGIKMVNYDMATEEVDKKNKYASGGQVETYPQLLAALRAKGTSAGSPSFSSPPSLGGGQSDSSNPILDLLKQGGDMKSLKSGIGSITGKVGNLFSGPQFDNAIGPTMKADSSGFFGMGGNQGGPSWASSIGNFFGFAEGGEVNFLESTGDKLLNDANTWSEYTQPSEEDSYAKRMGKNALHTTEATLPLLLGKAMKGMGSGQDSLEGLYNDLFVKPMSQLDAERQASQLERETAYDAPNSTDDLIGAKLAEGQPQSPEGMGSLLSQGVKGAPMPLINPETGDPYNITAGMGATGKGNIPLNLVPQVMESQVSSPAPQGESDIMALLKQQMAPAPKAQEAPKEEGGVNMPLLMAGLAMMSSKGDASTALAEGAAAFMGAKSNSEKSQQDEADRAEVKRQQGIKNLLDYLKIQAYMQQVQGKTGTKAITPYQQAMIELKKQGIDIQRQNANTKEKAVASGMAGLFGAPEEALTSQGQNGNLEDILNAFAEQEANRSTAEPIDASLLGE